VAPGCAAAGTRLPFIQYLVSLALVEAIDAEVAPLLGGDAAGAAAAKDCVPRLTCACLPRTAALPNAPSRVSHRHKYQDDRLVCKRDLPTQSLNNMQRNADCIPRTWDDWSGGAPAVGLGVRIKWPNDLYLGEAKLGGVLCNSVYRDRHFQAQPAASEPSTPYSTQEHIDSCNQSRCAAGRR